MKNLTKVISIALAVMMVMCVLCACAPQEEHVCHHICEKCGKCKDLSCLNSACSDKCQGHVEEKEPTVNTYDLRVMSYNLAQDNQNCNAHHQMIFDEIMDVYPDILGVQEEANGWENYLKKELKSMGYEHVVYYRGGPAGYDEASGIFYNASRFELLDDGCFWISETPDVYSIQYSWGTEFPRICNWVKLKDKYSGFTFMYFNTHFSYENVTVGLEGAKVVVAKIAELGDYPCFFSGDLNFVVDENHPQNQVTYDTLAAKLGDSRVEAKSTMTGGTYHNYGKNDGDANGSDFIGYNPMDYIWFTKSAFTAESFTIVKEEGEFGANARSGHGGGESENQKAYTSDHYAIYADFTYQVTVND